MGFKINILDEVEDLHLLVYLVGYANEGESILFAIKSSHPRERVLYSGVIDSYENKKGNQTINLIKELGIDNLSFLCWSHPDSDHYKGIDTIFEQFCDKNTRIVLPESLLPYRDRLSEGAQEICEKISRTIQGKKDR